MMLTRPIKLCTAIHMQLKTHSPRAEFVNFIHYQRVCSKLTHHSISSIHCNFRQLCIDGPNACDFKKIYEKNGSAFNEELCLSSHRDSQLLKKFIEENSIKIKLALDNIEYLKSKGFFLNAEFFMKNSWILKLDFISDKFEKVESLFKSLKLEYLPLLRLSFRNLSSAEFIWNEDSSIIQDLYDSRIEYISSLIESSEFELCCMASDKHYPIITAPLKRIDHILKLLRDNGVDPMKIKRDMWIIRHNIDLMKKRIEICKRLNVPIKVWLLRSDEEIFLNSISRTTSNKRVLCGFKDAADYLAMRLNSDRERIDDICEKNPNIIRINPVKLEESLNFFLQRGFSSEDILHLPRVLTLKVATCRRRLELLEELDYNDMHKKIWVVCLDNKGFDLLYERMKWRKKQIL